MNPSLSGRRVLVVKSLGKGPKSVGEIRKDTGLPQTTIYRYLNSFARRGLVEKVEGQRYALTSKGRMTYDYILENK